jgi:hypothetical protein
LKIEETEKIKTHVTKGVHHEKSTLAYKIGSKAGKVEI